MTSESSEESHELFNGSTETPLPQTPATPPELRTGRLPPTETVATPGVDGLTRPTAARIRARRKPVPSVVDLMGYEQDPLSSHPLTPKTPGTPGTPGTPKTVGHGGGHRFTIGPLAGVDLPDLGGDQRSSGHSSKYSGATLQNPSVLSLPMKVLEVDRPSLEGTRAPVRRSTYDCFSTYTCSYNDSRPDLSAARSTTYSSDDRIVPPPRRQSLCYRNGPRKKLSAASELEQLRRMTHYASMDFDSMKRHNRVNQSSLLVGDDSDNSSNNDSKDGPVTKRLKKLSLKKQNTTNYTKASAKLMNTIEEKQPDKPQGWLQWVCDAVPCLHREKASIDLLCWISDDNRVPNSKFAQSLLRTRGRQPRLELTGWHV